MGIGPPELRTLTEDIVRQAAPAYLMAVAGNADPMLGYLTYGLDHKGQSRWGSRSAAGFDHSWTTAVCGIHRRGKPPETAVEEIAKLVDRIFAQRCSGVALS